MGAENLAPTGIRPPNRPSRSDSLYRSRYPAPVIPAGYRRRTSQSVTAGTSLISFPTIRCYHTMVLTWITCTIKCTINVQTNLVSASTGVILHLSHQCRITKALPPLHLRQLLIITVMASTNFSTRIALMTATGKVNCTLTISKDLL